MFWLPVNIFRKSAHCPASETLLIYRKSQVARGEKAFIEAHLATCEFCSAELHLLDCYRHSEEETVLAEIPEDIRKLAEELLPHRTSRPLLPVETVEKHHFSH
jgi:hypothetical protein